MDFELLFLLKKGGFDGQRQKLGSRMSVLSEQSHGSKQLQPLSRGKADCKYNLKVLLTLDIIMYILHTVLNTFPKVLTRRICSPIKSFFSC